MNKTPAEAAEFAKAILPILSSITGVDIAVCPPAISIPAVHSVLAGTVIKLGAQDVHFELQGAFTSGISALMLRGLVDYVIIGHSEVRQYLGETDEQVNKKVKTTLANGLKPIIAVGENLAQNRAGETESFVGGQVRAAFDGVDAGVLPQITVAYEPIWAIGTGMSASGEQAN